MRSPCNAFGIASSSGLCSKPFNIPSVFPSAYLQSEVDPAGFEGRLRDAMNAEIEAAVHAVHDAVEVELEGVSSTLQDTVADVSCNVTAFIDYFKNKISIFYFI